MKSVGIRMFIACALVAPLASSSLPKLALEHYRLPNGMQVILHVNKRLPIVHLNVRYRVGAKDERPGRTGFAHLFEHMLGQGVDPTADFTVLMERAGANANDGTVNGGVDHDFTEFYETVPSGSLERAIWLESNRFAKLGEAVTQANLDRQREIVRNERRQKVENQPYGRFNMLIHQHLFPQGHPYSHDVIGSHHDLQAATLDDVKEFYYTYYTPDNLTLVIAGDFDPAEAKKLVAKYYGPIPPGRGIARAARWTPKLSAPKVVEVKDRVPYPRVFIVWPTPALFEPGDADLDAASLVLSEGPSIKWDPLASEIQYHQVSKQDASYFVATALARPGVPLAKLEQAITEEIANLVRRGPSAEALARARNRLEFSFLSHYDTLQGVATRLNHYAMSGAPDRFAEDYARREQVTAESVKNAVAQWLDTPNRLVIRFEPDGTSWKPAPEPDRTEAPPLRTDGPLRLPEIQSSRLGNGMDVFVVERRDTAKVFVLLASKIGMAYNPPGKEGLSVLTTTAMNRGTKTRTHEQIERELAGFGTKLQASAQLELTSVGVQVLKKHLPPAFAIISDMVRNPAFLEEDVAREKKEWLVRGEQSESNPESVADSLANLILLGRDHAFARPLGDPDTIAALTRADVVAFHEAHWKPGNLALIFAGDISLEEAIRLAEEKFGDWQGGTSRPAAIPQPRPMRGRVFLIDWKGAPQTVVRQLLPAVSRTSPEYPALFLADKVWGGMFASRLMQNIRQEKGYAYGAGSFITFPPGYGIWGAASPVQTDKTKEAIAEFVKELRLLGGDKPISGSELELAKTSGVRGYANQFETPEALVHRIAQFWARGIPMSEMEGWPQAIMKTSLESVNAFVRKYARPERQMLLMVGDLDKIEPGIRALDLGEIVVLDRRGMPVQ